MPPHIPHHFMKIFFTLCTLAASLVTAAADDFAAVRASMVWSPAQSITNNVGTIRLARTAPASQIQSPQHTSWPQHPPHHVGTSTHSTASKNHKHGCTGQLVLVAPDNTNDVFITHDFPSVQAAESFAHDPGLREGMERAGVAGSPRIEIFTSV